MRGTAETHGAATSTIIDIRDGPIRVPFGKVGVVNLVWTMCQQSDAMLTLQKGDRADHSDYLYLPSPWANRRPHQAKSLVIQIKVTSG